MTTDKSIYLFFSLETGIQALTFGTKSIMEHLTEYTGYFASAMVLISFLMKNMQTLRIVNTIGCLLFIGYGILLGSIPVVVTNAAIVVINSYYLIRMRMSRATSN